MTHTYKITGMTCNGCRSHVEKTLSEVAGVSKATVDLEKAEATIEMESHIPIETFQKAMTDDGDSYSIHKLGDYQMHVYSETNVESGIQKFEESIDVDLIVMYTHSRKGLSSMFSNSIAEDVTNHSKKPVMTVHL